MGRCASFARPSQRPATRPRAHAGIESGEADHLEEGIQTPPTAERRVRRSSTSLPHERVDFAHNSERQFAKLLDFYQIDWDYEPTSFDIQWDRDGNPSQRFTPDFYLPDFDLYIEITTLNQKLVTKKNRKVRRLMALYPDVRCKVLYQRDYLNLLVKYGLEEPSQKTLLAERESPEKPRKDEGEPPFLGPALAG